jgi:hypothetical protein
VTSQTAFMTMAMAMAAGCRGARGVADAGPGGPSGAVVLIGEEGDAHSLLIGYFVDLPPRDVPPAICPGGADATHCCLVPRGIGLPVVSPLLFPAETQFEGPGLLTVTDASTGADLGTVTPGADGYGAMYQSSQLGIWADQDRLSVAAGAGDFPAFDWSVRSPAAWSGLDPSIASGAAGVAAMTVPVSSDFTVTWTPQPDLNDAIVGAMGTDSSASVIECYGLEGDGRLTFPSNLLEGHGSGGGSLSLFRTHWQTNADDAGATVALGASSMLGRDVEYQ